MKNIGYFVAGMQLLCSSLFASITMVENTATRLTFKWEMGKFDTVSVKDSGKTVTSLSFPDNNIAMGLEGEPVVPGVSVFAGMPLSGNVIVHFSPGPVRTILLSNPLRKNSQQSSSGSFRKKDAAQFDNAWVSNPRYSWFRAMRTANVVIRPVSYDPASRTLEVLSGGECTIEFPAGAASSSVPGALTDYQRMLKKLVLNYDVAAKWVTPSKRPLRKTADIYTIEPGAERCIFKIGDGHSGINEATIRENGMVKITGAQMVHKFKRQPGTIGISSVALFASCKGPLPEPVPGIGAIPAGVTEVPLIRIDRDNDGFVDEDDYFLAYVTGLSDWVYDSVSNDFVFSVDKYADDRSYILTIKSVGTGMTMRTFQQPSGAADTLTSFENRIVFKQSNWPPVSIGSGGLPSDIYKIGFVWERLFPQNTTFGYVLDLPYLDTTAGGSLRFSTISNQPRVRASLSGDSLCTECQSENNFPVAHWGNRRLEVNYADLSALDYWQLVSIRAKYQSRLLAPAGDTARMHVFSSGTPGTHCYRFTGMENKRAFILRVPNDDGAVTLIDSGISGGKSKGCWNDSGGGVRYFIADEAGFITLDDAALQSPTVPFSNVVTDLRDVNNETDYLIITHPVFRNEAIRLAAHKAQNGFTCPRVVITDDIYSGFSGGNFDPVAIRNFLAYVRQYWKNGDKLDYAVLFGKGHMDFKGVKTTETNFIPPMEEDGFSESLCLDDFYAVLDPGSSGDLSNLTLAMGRLPCMTAGEAATMVDKIIETEDTRKADWGSWRNSMLFVADDDMQRDIEDQIKGTIAHYASSERVAGVVGSLRPSMTLRKAYLFEYPWNASYEKPEASRAIINEINSGVGFVNFFGHGSPVQWTDERVLSPAEVPQFYNARQYPVISSYSCGVGLFDLPGKVSLSEDLVKAPGAGAIAAISAARSSGATSNEMLAMNFYRSMFDTARTIGMAMVAAKALTNDANSEVYLIMGDPAIRFFEPARTVRLEIDDSFGKPLSDTLKALQPITIKGTIVDANGNPDVSFGSLTTAYVQLGFYNASEVTTRKDGGSADPNVEYLMPGKPVFSGKTPVRDGAFIQTTVLPRNLSFDKTGPRLIAYAWEGDKVGLGCKNTIFHGSVSSSSTMKTDSSGPRITIRPLYDIDAMRSTESSFSDRITSSLPFKCEIEIYDQNGIDVNGIGPDEGLTMEIPGVMSRRNINQKFKFSEGDYRNGTAVLSFEENSLHAGKYTLVATAQDMVGNVSRSSFAVEITEATAFNLDHVFNSPNPMRMGERTQFFFYPSSTTTQNTNPPLQFGIMIKIYSLSGRLLRVIKNARNGEYWDGRDQTGYQLPPNIYLYQVTAWYPQQEKQTKSKIEKVVIHPPR